MRSLAICRAATASHQLEPAEVVWMSPGLLQREAFQACPTGRRSGAEYLLIAHRRNREMVN